MKIEFIGAAQEVTGSKHLIHINGKKILLDCGMYHGRRKVTAEKNKNWTINPKEIDAVVLSHAHIDHSGLLPYLVKSGYNGPIFSTHATRDLCNYMLSDSAYIQEKDAEWLNKKLKKGEPLIEPLYNLADAKMALNNFYGIGYDRAFVIEEGVVGCFYDAGHILGAACIHLICYEKDRDKRHYLGFTGDLGRKNIPILRDPEVLPRCDYLISECTYGNRLHESLIDADAQLIDIVNDTFKKGGKLIIPAFSVGRTQEIVYRLNVALKHNKIPDFPIYVDSPLSGNITEVFSSHTECFDDAAYNEFLKVREDPFGFERIKYIKAVEESKKLNSHKGPCIIISASGMCEFGRIVHHLKNNIEDPKNSVLLVGYQAEHTLGRKLQDGMPIVNIFGEPYKVKADIHTIHAFSAHADRSDLIDYIGRIKDLKKIFLVHHEKEQGEQFKNILGETGYKDVNIPAPGDIFEL